MPVKRNATGGILSLDGSVDTLIKRCPHARERLVNSGRGPPNFLSGEFDTGVESEVWVNELLLGFGARYYGIGLSFTQTIRSDEFDGQTENQIFGSLMLRVDSAF